MYQAIQSGGKCNMAVHYFHVHLNITCDAVSRKKVYNILSLVYTWD